MLSPVAPLIVSLRYAEVAVGRQGEEEGGQGGLPLMEAYHPLPNRFPLPQGHSSLTIFLVSNPTLRVPNLTLSNLSLTYHGPSKTPPPLLLANPSLAS